KVEIATLLANDFDPDGDPVTFIAASTNSTHGGIVTQEGSWIVYLRPPSFTNVDSFTYTISDGRGVPVTGTVEVLIQPEAGPAVNLTIEDLGGGFYRLRFSGVPNQTTIIQYTTNLYPPDWQVLTNGTTDSYGVFDYVDQPLGGTESRFYRSLCP
ncbi:MAG: Ig-like domain-containing protein, partial [Verrucomicrobia bacterium]|nr:Ig-like domain-containing protein [Verrucomicrobiota bacterium]